jgi:hypothetical protein
VYAGLLFVYLALGNDGEGEADDVDVVGQHLLGHLAGKAGIAQHHRADRVSVVTQHLRKVPAVSECVNVRVCAHRRS